MESNYKLDKTKEAALVIHSDYKYELLDADMKNMYALPYDIYNINCFYDYNNPLEFLNVLTNYATQKSLELTIDKIGKDVYAIKHVGNVVARYIVARRHLEIEADNTYYVLDMRYGNKINTFNVLKYILDAISISKYLDSIKSMEHSEFKILDVKLSTKKWIYGFKSAGAKENLYTITLIDLITDMRFTAEYKYESKSVRFINYLDDEKEIYTNGSEPLTMEEIERNIKFYTALRDRMDPIEMYLETLERKL